MNYTENYQLPQWEESDRVLMADFNAAMSNIENALAGKPGASDLAEVTAAVGSLSEELNQLAAGIPKMMTGSYTGNGSAGLRKISTPYRPIFLILFNQDPKAGQYTYICALGTSQIQCALASSTASCVCTDLFSLEDSGFQIRGDRLGQDYGFNRYGVSYQYIAIR